MRLHRPVPLQRIPTVSVVIPHFNYGQFLPFAVDSALKQAGVDIEVIIVDDKSTDGSAEVARQIAASDARVSLVEHETNMRHIRTYNDGLARACGDYVVLLSADDALTPDSLSRSVALMEAHPDVGLVYGRVEWFDGEPPAFVPSPQWWQVWSGEEWIGRIARRGRNAVANPEVVMRRAVYSDTGGYDPEFPHAGDMYMWLQAAARAHIGFVGGPRQALYRNHGGNMHSVDFGGILDDMRQVRDTFRRFFTADGARLPAVGELLDTSMRAVAREAVLRGALLVADGANDDVLRAFQEFALETAPGVDASPTWRWAELSQRKNTVRGGFAHVERMRWRIRSRRSDAVGL